MSSPTDTLAGRFSDADEDILDLVQRQTFRFCWESAHSVSRLARDRQKTTGDPGNDLVVIGGSGFGVIKIIVAVERGWVSHDDAVDRIGTMLSCLDRTPLALAADPELVIADEPTTALDVSVQAQVIALLKRLCKDRGTSVMLITHDMGVIAETADRVCILYAGRLAEIGTVRDVVKHPQHPYTHGLMTAIPSLTGDPDARLQQIPGAMPRLDAIPQGCAFNPRCDFSFERCVAERPPLYETAAGDTACFLHDPDPLHAPPRPNVDKAAMAGLVRRTQATETAS